MNPARRRPPFDGPPRPHTTSSFMAAAPSGLFSTSQQRRYTPSTSTPGSSPTTSSSSPPPISPTSSFHPGLHARAYSTSKAAPLPTHGRDTVLIRRHESPVGGHHHARDPSDRRIREGWEEDVGSYAYVKRQSAFAGPSSLPSSPIHPYSLGAHPGHRFPIPKEHFPHHFPLSQADQTHLPTRHTGPFTQQHRHEISYHVPQRKDHQREPISHDAHVSNTSPRSTFRGRAALMHNYGEDHREISPSGSLHPSTSLDPIPRDYSNLVHDPPRRAYRGASSPFAPGDMDMDVIVGFPPALDPYLPRSPQDEFIEDVEGDDKVVLFTSPRRRVSFSTSSERDTPLPPRLPSLAATISSRARTSEVPVKEVKVGLPTPPASEHSTTPEYDRDAVLVAPKDNLKDGALTNGDNAQGSHDEAQGHRRTRSRPTLMDLLSGPPCPPPSPVKGVAAWSPRETEESPSMVQQAKFQQRDEDVEMLPTPEDDETVHFRIAPVSPLARPHSLPPESSDPDLDRVTSEPDRVSAPPSEPIEDSPARQSSPLPPSSPPQYSSPVKDASSTVFSPFSSPAKDSLPPSSPPRRSPSCGLSFESFELSRRPSTPLVRSRRPSTPPLLQHTLTPATPEPTYELNANDLLSSPLSPEPSPEVGDEAETATCVQSPEQSPADLHVKHIPRPDIGQEESADEDMTHSMSSPLSPAPSSRASSLPATSRGTKRPADDVLPVLHPRKRPRDHSRKATPIYTDDSESEEEIAQVPANSGKTRRKAVRGEGSEGEKAPPQRPASRKGKQVQRGSDDEASLKKAATKKARSPDSEDEDLDARPKSKKRAKTAKSREDVDSESDAEVQVKGQKERCASSSSSRPSPPAQPRRRPSSPPRESTPSDIRPRGRRGRGRKKSAGSDASAWRALDNIDWEAEAPVPLPELEGMIIETLAASRATSMSGQAILGVLQTRESVRTRTRRRRLRSDADADAEGDGGEGEEMDRMAWMHVLTHVLTSGHAGSGVFGRVDSSASDSDAPSPSTSPASPSKPRMRLSHRAALLAQWYYVPERDTDKERASIVQSTMRGPGKRSVTKTYKQYYFKPLAKISRWDPEDDL